MGKAQRRMAELEARMTALEELYMMQSQHEAACANDAPGTTSVSSHYRLRERLANVMRERDDGERTSWDDLAEAVIQELQDHPDFLRAHHVGTPVPPPGAPQETRDNEADFQDFLSAYDMPARIERLLRVAYLVGVADAQALEM